ncbi:MAG: condensation domain-containing protein [Candidatus Coproplasma sp.]
MKEYRAQPLDLMQFINTKFHEPFIHELIEFEGKININRLKAAIAKLVGVFPLLKCRYDSDKNTFTENAGFSVDDVLVLDDAADRQALLTQSLNAGEKLILFTLSNNALVVTVSHLVCDGSGFKSLIYLLCDIYNGKDRGDYSHLMNREFYHLTKEIKGTAGITLKMIFSMFGSYKNTKIYQKTDSESVYLIEKTISAKTMSAVHTAARKRGATLNDVFLTAYARAIGKLNEQRKINIPCTVDLRKYAKDTAGIANLTGTYTLNVKINPDDDFAKSLGDVSAKMRRQKQTKNDIAGPMLLVSKYGKSTLDKFLKTYGGMNTSPFTDYSNLGVLDENKLVFSGVKIKNAVGYGCLNKAPYFSVAISSFKGESTLSSMVLCGEGEKKKVERLLNAIAEEIEKSFKKV